VATKENKRNARGLIEALESRLHVGPPIRAAEIVSAREFLRQTDFPPASDYFNRLSQIEDRLGGRAKEPSLPQAKRNYGGEAAGCWMQLQSAYDHVILSACYEGEFNMKRGRIKISHRFNQAGRIDFVELKFLRSMHSLLDGAIRKLVTVKDYQTTRKDWRTAEAFVLEILPRELIFLYEDIFKCPRNEILAWLINIGPRLVGDLLEDLKTRPSRERAPQQARNPDQLCLQAIRTDEVALPILQKAASLEAVVELKDPKTVMVRYALGLEGRDRFEARNVLTPGHRTAELQST